MPSDSNGVYSLPDGYLAVTGETILASQHNPPLEDLAASMTLRLMTSGVNPMTGPLKGYAGSAAAPTFTSAGAPTGGFYPTADGWGVSIGGTKVAEFTSAGLKTGSRYIGELIPYSGQASLPPLCIYPAGQTVSRTTYAALWTFAQAEIAAGNTFYNNGNGTTTFGVGDLRGRVLACKDSILSVAGRLSFGDGIGNTGGTETITLTTAQIPSHTHANSLSDPGHVHDLANSRQYGGFNGNSGPPAVVAPQLGNGYVPGEVPTTSKATGLTITNAAQGGGGAHNNTQPTIVGIYLLFAGA